MKEEIWKDIKGFEGLYQVSNLGRVRSLDRQIYSPGSWRQRPYYFNVKGKIIKQHKSNSGYMFVRLSKDRNDYGTFVHRLVADAFIQNPNNYEYVNHKDENKHNNKVDNLEWCTAKYNINYGTCKQRNQVGNIRNRRPVIQMTKDGCEIYRFVSIREASKMTGIRTESISLVCRVKMKNGRRCLTAGGYRWRFAE